MSKAVVLNGDIVNFDASFGEATIVPVPGTITGTGTKLSSGSIVCVEGDESSVIVAGVSYIKGIFVGGLGKLTIKQLNSDQKATKLTVGGKGKKANLVGSKFDALFTVGKPAQQPGSPPLPIPRRPMTGKGRSSPPT